MLKIKNWFIGVKKLVTNSEVVNKTLKNSSWLMWEKIFYMVIGVFVTAIVARYFGPENYGQFNFALAFVTLFTAISTLGMETLTVKSIVDESYDEGTILCTSLIMRLGGGALLTIIAVAIIKIIEHKDINLQILVAIMSFTMVLKSLEVIEYWIQAYQKAKVSSLIRMGSYVVLATLKILMVVMGGSLITYALIYTLDAAITGTALMVAYFHIRNKVSTWRFKLVYLKSMLSQSWYLILSGLMVTLYMRIDQVMLGSMLPDRIELGVYSAAVQVAEMWYFIPMAIITSFKPVIMNNKLKDKTAYLRAVQLLYSIVTWIGIGAGMLILLCSKPIVFILYGAAYMKAASILSISIWAGTFAVLGSARSIWLICEGLQKYTPICVFAGCVCNILLNYFMIPLYGGFGAAADTLLSQIVAVLIVPAFFKDTRVSTIMMIEAFTLKGLKRN